MRIVMLGQYQSFDYYHIGGTDAIVRRLSVGLTAAGHEVCLVHFGAPTRHSEQPLPGLSLHYLPTLIEALQLVRACAEHVVSIYIPPRLRPLYAIFRSRSFKDIRFHHLFTVMPESRLKQRMLFAEARLVPYNGTLFCLSPRLKALADGCSARTCLLLPPVPDRSLLSTTQKSVATQLRITYMGRVDPGKGTLEAFCLLRELRHTGRYCVRMFGYPWPHRPEAVDLHGMLLAQSDVYYEPVEYDVHSPGVDERVRATLCDTDVLLLPYQRLSSTIDIPLVMLEGMAHLCAIVTRPLGDLRWLYGDDRLMLNNPVQHDEVARLLDDLTLRLPEERLRLHARMAALGCGTSQVVETFMECLHV